MRNNHLEKNNIKTNLLSTMLWGLRDIANHYRAEHGEVLTNLERSILDFLSDGITEAGEGFISQPSDSSTSFPFLLQTPFEDFLLCLEVLLVKRSLKIGFTSNYNIDRIKNKELKEVIEKEIKYV